MTTDNDRLEEAKKEFAGDMGWDHDLLKEEIERLQAEVERLRRNIKDCMDENIVETVTETKEHPIIFSGEMVRAILEGRKTQTRRVIKDLSTVKIQWVDDVETFPNGKRYTGWIKECGAPLDIPIKCPYGVPGDRLWVRETWCLKAGNCGRVLFKAEGGWSDVGHWEIKWKPSIYMPRWASRILLEITNVRVERVQDISQAGCVNEGVHKGWDSPNRESPHEWFKNLWNSINEMRGYGWEVNPWVWTVEFKVITNPESPGDE